MGKAHLVGSVNLADARAVFESVAASAGTTPRIPDGETDRPFVTWFIPKVLAHPAVVREEGSAVEGLLPRISILPEARADLDFGELGFAEAAVRSFALFRQLQGDGVIEPDTRFQVSIPSALTLAPGLAAPSDQEPLYEAFLRTLSRELGRIVDEIPHELLAVQIDMPGEIGILEGLFHAWFGTDLGPIAEQARRMAAVIPADVHLGFHLCYGDPPPAEGGGRGRHWLEPKDTTVLVSVANAISDAVERPIQWFHMPVPIDRDDDAYFAPLSELRLGPETELYLGLVHDADGMEGTMRRVTAARKFVSDLGVGTECGMGRVPADEVPALITLQGEVAAAL